MANRLERAHKESVHTDAVKELQAQMQRLSKRFDTIATEMCQLETRINSL
jgi:chaperonin cofactor prefoldin